MARYDAASTWPSAPSRGRTTRRYAPRGRPRPCDGRTAAARARTRTSRRARRARARAIDRARVRRVRGTAARRRRPTRTPRAHTRPCSVFSAGCFCVRSNPAEQALDHGALVERLAALRALERGERRLGLGARARRRTRNRAAASGKSTSCTNDAGEIVPSIKVEQRRARAGEIDDAHPRTRARAISRTRRAARTPRRGARRRRPSSPTS